MNYKVIAIVRETQKAILLRIQCVGDKWIPKSQIISLERGVLTLAERGNNLVNSSQDCTRFITIFSDASYKSGIFGAGVWIKYSSSSQVLTPKTLLLGINGKCKDNSVAELIGLQTGLNFVIDNLKPPENRIIVVQCDSQFALQRIDTTKCNVPVYKKHVKGHQGGKNPRSWVNELCDKVASTMRKQHNTKPVSYDKNNPRKILLDYGKFV